MGKFTEEVTVESARGRLFLRRKKSKPRKPKGKNKEKIPFQAQV